MRRAGSAMALAAAAVLVGCGPKQKIAMVTFTEVSQPTKTLDEKHMNIAVLNAQTKLEGEGAGEYDQKKWATMTADLMQHYLQEAAEADKLPLKLVDREHLAIAMQEKDLAAAGVSDAGDAVGQAQVQGATAILTSKITIKIDKQVGKKRTVKAANVAAWAGHWGGGGGGGVDTEEVSEESRNITVQCQFQLKDSATNEILFDYVSRPDQEFTRTKAGAFFGSSKTEADMTPRDEVIGGKIDAAARAFLGRFLKIQTESSVRVKSSHHPSSIAGVEALNAEDYDQALKQFKEALADEKNKDDHESMYGAGVCLEKLGKIDEARKYYRQAMGCNEKDPEYRAAVARTSKR